MTAASTDGGCDRARRHSIADGSVHIEEELR